MDADLGNCEIAECGRPAQHNVQVEKDDAPFGAPLALCDQHVVPYLPCGQETCSEGATEVLWCTRENLAAGADDRRALFACDVHAREIRESHEVVIDGLPFRFGD